MVITVSFIRVVYRTRSGKESAPQALDASREGTADGPRVPRPRIGISRCEQIRPEGRFAGASLVSLS
jgi:hypothetical protein